ncbi:hypothetical protein GF362_07290 [Candidatus Dojkabacteria bacterium]|nr:hypothetical protein [Candidatus Dojkabacteria bacterium]
MAKKSKVKKLTKWEQFYTKMILPKLYLLAFGVLTIIGLEFVFLFVPDDASTAPADTQDQSVYQFVSEEVDLNAIKTIQPVAVKQTVFSSKSNDGYWRISPMGLYDVNGSSLSIYEHKYIQINNPYAFPLSRQIINTLTKPTFIYKDSVSMWDSLKNHKGKKGSWECSKYGSQKILPFEINAINGWAQTPIYNKGKQLIRYKQSVITGEATNAYWRFSSGIGYPHHVDNINRELYWGGKASGPSVENVTWDPCGWDSPKNHPSWPSISDSLGLNVGDKIHGFTEYVEYINGEPDHYVQEAIVSHNTANPGTPTAYILKQRKTNGLGDLESGEQISWENNGRFTNVGDRYTAGITDNSIPNESFIYNVQGYSVVNYFTCDQNNNNCKPKGNVRYIIGKKGETWGVFYSYQTDSNYWTSWTLDKELTSQLPETQMDAGEGLKNIKAIDITTFYH